MTPPSTAPAPSPRNTLSAILNRLEQLEAEIAYNDPPAERQQPFRYVAGRLPVLLSAPHGAAHRRDGRYKEEDEYTAAFARLVAERTGAHVLYACARSESDPNWDTESPYKAALGEIVAGAGIRFVGDIHGMGNRHRFGIAVGTMCGASCPARHEELIASTLTAGGFHEATPQESRAFEALRWERFVVNHGRFTGGLTSHTVTRYTAERLGIHAAQFELCASLRIVRRRATERWPHDFRGDPAGIARAVAAFERLVHVLAEGPAPRHG